MTDSAGAKIIFDSGIIAIMRASSPDQLLAAADAIRAGGVRAIEVTLTTPGALDTIQQASGRYGQDVLFGAGSVLDAESARAAILAGAQFVVCPTFDPATVALCRRYSVPVFPGAFTPTEILTAWQAGADCVKVFPLEAVGASYLKAIKAPLPQIRLAAVGGVTLDTAADFIRAGADVLGVGSSLVNQKLLDEKNFAAITERSRRFCEAVEEARNA